MSRPSLCDGLDGEYSLGLHVASIFVVLGSSILGTCIPILTKHIRILRENPFFFVVAKTAATGVLLSVSCIHLINDAVTDFNEPCVNKAFKSFYTGYAFLFALVAALLMHAVDLQLAVVTERWMKLKEEKDREEAEKKALKTDEEAIHVEPTASNEDRVEGPASPGHTENGFSPRQVTEAHSGNSSTSTLPTTIVVAESKDKTRVVDAIRSPRYQASPRAGASPMDQAHSHGEHFAAHDHRSLEDGSASEHHHGHAHSQPGALEGCHGHSHAIALPPSDAPQIRRIIAAICMEFGVTLHSLFVGLDIGLTTDRVLKPLLIALVFHQLFEGISLGSRLVDAKFRTAMEVSLAMVFSVSAPLGMAAATIAVSVKRDAMSGGGFVLMMAVLNSFCGGILLYLAFNLLFTDFCAELSIYGTERNPGKRAAMFIAVWVGMLSMAIVGKWL